MSKTIFEQIGGEPSVIAAVDIFYDKVLADELLMEFFQDVNMKFLKSHQKSLITFLCGGDIVYKGKDLRTAHRHLKLEEVHFDQIVLHLTDTLNELGVPEDIVSKIIEKIEFLRFEVLNL